MYWYFVVGLWPVLYRVGLLLESAPRVPRVHGGVTTLPVRTSRVQRAGRHDARRVLDIYVSSRNHAERAPASSARHIVRYSASRPRRQGTATCRLTQFDVRALISWNGVAARSASAPRRRSRSRFPRSRGTSPHAGKLSSEDRLAINLRCRNPARERNHVVVFLCRVARGKTIDDVAY